MASSGKRVAQKYSGLSWANAFNLSVTHITIRQRTNLTHVGAFIHVSLCPLWLYTWGVCFIRWHIPFERAEAAYDEIDILGTVAKEEDASGKDSRVVRIIDHFMHRGPHGMRTSSNMCSHTHARVVA
jgi:hypothetical protein